MHPSRDRLTRLFAPMLLVAAVALAVASYHAGGPGDDTHAAAPHSCDRADCTICPAIRGWEAEHPGRRGDAARAAEFGYALRPPAGSLDVSAEGPAAD